MTTAPSDRLIWIKASRSMGTNACVELAAAGELIALRDSKHPEIAPFFYSRAEIDAFLHGAKQGEFDHLLDGVRPIMSGGANLA
jgi:hypothetical protein